MEEAAASAASFDLEEEREYQAAQALFVHPPRVQQQKLQILLFSVLAFAGATVVQGTAGSFIDLAMLIGVILFHELGHMVAMLLFGYRDVKIFFIPFLGGAASGKKRGVARWKEGIVLLCGPLPGIALGVALAYLGEGGHMRMLALQLIIVNGLNLLPVMPLDGGQLFQLLLFSRHRKLELVFLGVTATLVAVGGLLAEMWVLGIVGVFILVGLPHRKRLLETAHRYRDRGWPVEPEALDDTQRRELYRAAMAMIPPEWRARWRGKPQPQAQMMEQILERATQRPPSADATAGLLAVWLAALLAVVMGISQAIGVAWQPYTNHKARFAIELPAAADAPIEREGWHLLAMNIGGDEYTVMWNELPDAASWMAATADNLVDGSQATVLASTPTERRITYVERGSRVLMRLVAVGQRAYMVGAFTKSDHADGERFVGSFRPLD